MVKNSFEQVSWEMVEQARKIISNNLPKTPLIECINLSEKIGVRSFLKLECLQPTGSFKVRGGLVKLLSTGSEKKGVVCASTGNHGKSIAFLAKKFKLPAWVVVPKTASPVKTQAIESLGATLMKVGDTYNQADDFAKNFASEKDLLYASSFDDPSVVAAQATVAWEILEDEPTVNTLVVPVGGGGLLAGSLLAMKYLKPSLRVIGVEAEGAPSLLRSVELGEIVSLSEVRTLADGIAIPRPGTVPFQVIQKLLTEPLVLVSDEEMAQAVRFIVSEIKVCSELAGSASVAGLLSGKISVQSDAIVACIISGGNISLKQLAQILNG